jgi:hypothetical protein
MEDLSFKRSYAPPGSSYELIKIRGTLQNPTFNIREYEEIIDHFQTRDDDHFVCTYVKSGTTWTQQVSLQPLCLSVSIALSLSPCLCLSFSLSILLLSLTLPQIIHQILRRGNSGGSYGETVPWLEALSSEILSPREAPNWTMEKINAAPSPRFFKTHARVSDLPKGNGNIKVIYIARNPKDVAVSLYHHAKNKPEFQFSGDFDCFLKLFLSGQVENGSWFQHIQEWWIECQQHPGKRGCLFSPFLLILVTLLLIERYLFLFYEDICQDPLRMIQMIASFIGVHDLSEEVRIHNNAALLLSLSPLSLSLSLSVSPRFGNAVQSNASRRIRKFLLILSPYSN